MRRACKTSAAYHGSELTSLPFPPASIYDKADNGGLCCYAFENSRDGV